MILASKVIEEGHALYRIVYTAYALLVQSYSESGPKVHICII